MLLMITRSGAVHCLDLSSKADGESKIRITLFCTTSTPSCVAYIDSGYIFAGSQAGDSHLLQLSAAAGPASNVSGKVIDTHASLAPINDFDVVTSDQAGVDDYIVTCCGTAPHSTVSLISRGIELPVISEIPIPNIQRAFTISLPCDTDANTYLLLSTTRVSLVYQYSLHAPLKLLSGTIDKLCPDMSAPTIFAGNLPDGTCIQVLSQHIWRWTNDITEGLPSKIMLTDLIAGHSSISYAILKGTQLIFTTRQALCILDVKTLAIQ